MIKEFYFLEFTDLNDAKNLLNIELHEIKVIQSKHPILL